MRIDRLFKKQSTKTHFKALALLLSLSACSSEKEDFLDPSTQLPDADILTSVVVTPSQVSGFVGEAVKFSAYGRNQKGDSMAADVVWSATGGNVAQDGTYSPSSIGLFSVTATAKGNNSLHASGVVNATRRVLPTAVLLTSHSEELLTGESRQLKGRVYYDDGSSSVDGIEWVATSGAISAAGVVTAPNQAGNFTVIARAGEAADTAVVSVLPSLPKLVSIQLDVAALTMRSGDNHQFNVTSVWSDQSTRSIPVEFVATGGPISSSGLFTATAVPGVYRVVARSLGEPMADTAIVTIDLLPDTKLDVTPATLRLQPGATFRFNASATRSDGSSRVVTPTWQVQGGTIAADGTYKAGSALGTFTVIGTLGLVSDTSTVTVVSPTPTVTHLNVTPGLSDVSAGDSVVFTATATLSDGSNTTPPVTWSANGGSITADGHFVAPTMPGDYQVQATSTSGGIAAASRVTVRDPKLRWLDISPATVTIPSGTKTQFSISARWSDGSTTVPAITYTATGGTIDSTGKYTAGSQYGTYLVIASANNKADTALVTIPAPAAVLVSVRLVPDAATLSVNGTKQFSATGTWSTGVTSGVSVTYSVNGGSVSSSGLYSAGTTPGTYKLIARDQSGTLADTAVIQVDGPKVTGFRLSPDTTSLAAGVVQQYNTVTVWSDGGAYPVTVNYAATGGSVNTTGAYTAGSVSGNYRVIAACGCGLADSSSVRVTGSAPPAPTMTAIVINPGSTSLLAGASQQFTVSGQWSDGSTTAPAVTFAATGGSISSTGGYVAGSVAGVYKVIATQASGTLADTADVTVIVNNPPPPPPPTGGLPVALPAAVAKLMGPLTAASATPAAFAKYETDFVKFETSRWAQDSMGGGVANSGCVAGRNIDYTDYYDRAFALYQMWARTGDNTYRQRADAIVICYRDGYLVPANFMAQPNNWQFEGLAVHYLLTGDVNSLDALRKTTSKMYIAFPASKLTSENYNYWEGRIQARELMAVTMLDYLGDKSHRWDLIADSIATMSTKLQRNDGSYAWPSFGMTQANYMAGMLNYAFAMYYRLRSQNPAVLNAIKKSIDYMWNTQWLGTGFQYANAKSATGSTNLAADLTGLVVYGWGFYANVSGDLTYQTNGDVIFAAGIKGAYLYGQKQFNQQYRESALYLGLRH